ncbi:Phosphopantetheine attachment site, partial [Luteibacter sp. UNCMF366Tsu5.1]
EGLFAGQAQQHRDAVAWFAEDAELRDAVARWASAGRLERVAQAWVRGVEIPWSALHGGRTLPKTSLPTYPFARERYWLDLPKADVAPGASRLHPLLHENVSDLGRQAFRSTFRGDESFLRAHRYKRGGVTRPLMPAAAWIGMAHAAIDRAMPAEARAGAQLVALEDVVWAEPLFVDREVDVDIDLSLGDAGEVDVAIASVDGDAIRSHARLRARLANGALDGPDLPVLKARMTGSDADVETLYARFEAMGLIYGPEHRTLRHVARGADELLAQLDSGHGLPGEQSLAPELIDGALQSCIALLDSAAGAWLPFAARRIVVAAPCAGEMVAWVRRLAEDDATQQRFDIDIVDRHGRPCVRIEGLAVRRVPDDTSVDSVVAFVPSWSVPPLDTSEVTNGREHWCVIAPSDLAETFVESLGATSVERLDVPASDDAEGLLAHILVTVQRLAAMDSPPALRIACLAGVDDACVAALAALLATVGMEHPELSPCVIDVRTAGRAFAAAAVAARAGHVHVRIDADGSWRHRTWTEQALETKASVSIRRGGVYLVTGGLGGIGRLVARDLTSAGAQVVVTGRAAPDAAHAEATAALSVAPGGVLYRQLDLENAHDVRRLVASILAEQGRLDGVLHLAGATDDGPLAGKTRDEFKALLRPKVSGTRHLDDATRDVALDMFVLFSSVAGAFGNVGQADYAAANGYMDGFAAERARRVAAGERHGRSVSIGWPLWAEGGMRPDAHRLDMLARTTGMRALDSERALAVLHAVIASDAPHVAVLGGDVARLRRTVAALTREAAPKAAPLPASAIVPESSATAQERAEDVLRVRLAATLKMPASSIDPATPFEDYGLDSILAVRLVSELEKTFGELSKTLFYEHRTLRSLASFLLAAKPSAFPSTEAGAARPVAAPSPMVATALSGRRFAGIASPAAPRERDVAIVGLAGRYPMAPDLVTFWNNLREGRDCITDVPPDRWDVARYFDAEPGKPGTTYTRWGGFLDEIDRFDPLFFGISPKEAALLDPQERLFLETAWQAVEDAGYARSAVAGSRTGVFVGVMWGQYELYGAEALAAGQGVPSSSYASIANRVSWLLDLRGPSMAVDTMCSSSLTALHLACEEIRHGKIDAAIAGGVNANVHPHKYLTLSQGRFAATDGRCRSFGAGGDGYVPGEGVGAVFLKPLDQALRDGDHVYGIVRASALNHGGKSSGYTVPNPVAQAEVIEAAFTSAGVAADTVSYIEAHGTGTALGDPIEITGLARAFAARGGSSKGCAVGSVKSNIGHLEAAAGIAAVTKVLLQLRHGELVPTLHADVLNPNIAFASTPFQVQRRAEVWHADAQQPRRAGVSSFGAGGGNAHVVIEEWRDTVSPATAEGPVALVLSARDPVALAQQARRLATFLDDAADGDMHDIAYTLQVGRTAMDARLGLVAADRRDAAMRLHAWADARFASPDAPLSSGDDGLIVGHASQIPPYAQRLVEGEVGRRFVGELVARRDLARLVHLWVLGIALDWTPLHSDRRPRRLSLPTYPFQRQRCWIGPEKADDGAGLPAASGRLLRHWAETSRLASASVSSVLVADTDAAIAAAANMQPAPGRIVRLQDRHADLDAMRVFVQRLATSGGVPTHVLWRATDERDDALALMLLVRAMLEAGQAATLVAIVDEGAPLQEALAGLLRTLALEQPSWRTVTLTMAAGVSATADERTRLALDEAAAATAPTAEVRYTRHGSDGSWQRALRVARVEPGVGEASLLSPIRHGGTYLVTGGLGGLGRIVASDLMRRCQARVMLVGRSSLGQEGERELARMAAEGGEVAYASIDVSDPAAVEALLDQVRQRFGALHGVIHAAGTRRDGALLHKDADAFFDVTRAKIDGTLALDAATRHLDLDLFVLFSSMAGVNGNPGQADYAYANRFLDAFAAQREAWRDQGLRNGRTISIAWPLWEHGGMRVDAAQAQRLLRRNGIAALPTAEGLRHFHAALRAGEHMVVPLHGDLARLAHATATPHVPSAAVTPQAHVPPAPAASFDMLARVRELVAEETGVPMAAITENDRFDALGLDSVAIGRLTAHLRSFAGDVPQTLFYEQETVGAAAAYLVRHAPQHTMATAVAAPSHVAILPAARNDDAQEKIAIVGIHGRFPGGADLDAFWQTLEAGREAIVPVPASRWDAEAWYDASPDAAARGRIGCRHGGFIPDVEHFDAAFFRIPADEAAVMDPQERLFVESVWHALEDAGYTRQGLRQAYPRDKGANVGVFVGTTTQSYALLAESARRDGVMQTPTSLPWSIANRVSYLFDFRGPSMPVDTACSSALVGLHLASESLRRGECAVAVAGAVNLYLHPLKYLSLSQRGMLAKHGATRSFGAGDDGFVPGEGVATVILKRLSDALADGDRIHGVLAATGFEHAGRGNGYAAPNPNAQASLIRRVLAAGQIDPDSIDCVEGHGTGTPLGDEIELRALEQVLGGSATRTAPASLGCVKSNIGHLEAAAGMSSLAKVLLQMRHGRFVPTLHARTDAPAAAVVLQHAGSHWPAPAQRPRRALVNAFGAGGVNACIVLEDPPPSPASKAFDERRTHAFLLSAVDEDRLRAYAAAFAHWMTNASEPLGAICEAVSRREAMPVRLAVGGVTAVDVARELAAWVEGSPSRVQVASVNARAAAAAPVEGTVPDQAEAVIAAWLAGAWVPRVRGRVALPVGMPGYPFAPTSHWIARSAPLPDVAAVPSVEERLHPWVSYNASTLRQTAFDSWLKADEVAPLTTLRDDVPVLSMPALLEIATACGTLAGERRVATLRDVAFPDMLTLERDLHLVRTVLEYEGEGIRFRIGDGPGDTSRCFASGMLLPTTVEPADTLPRYDLRSLRSRAHPLSRAAMDARLGCHGMAPAHAGIDALWMSGAFALARIVMSADDRGADERFVMQPSLFGAIADTVTAWVDRDDPSADLEIAGIRELGLYRGLPRQCHVLVERAEGEPASIHASVLDEQGGVIATLRGITLKLRSRTPPSGSSQSNQRLAKETQDVRYRGMA